jgi:hypothetical protein
MGEGMGRTRKGSDHASHILIYVGNVDVKMKLTEAVFLNFKEPRNRYQGTYSPRLCSLAGRYENPIPNRFLAP